jgi:hypothetical protein
MNLDLQIQVLRHIWKYYGILGKKDELIKGLCPQNDGLFQANQSCQQH